MNNITIDTEEQGLGITNPVNVTDLQSKIVGTANVYYEGLVLKADFKFKDKFSPTGLYPHIVYSSDKTDDVTGHCSKGKLYKIRLKDIPNTDPNVKPFK